MFLPIKVKGIFERLDQIFNSFFEKFGFNKAKSKKGPFHLERLIKLLLY